MRTEGFAKWFNGLDGSVKVRVNARLLRVENESHFGKIRNLGDKVSEMKFSIPLRVYYTLAVDESGETCICLLGGDKDGQNDDIQKAKDLAEAIHGEN